LPEFIRNDDNGVLLDLPVNQFGEWVYSASPERFAPHFEETYAGEVERLAQDAFAAIRKLMDAPGALAVMRRSARATAENLFDARPASVFWDALYENALDLGTPHCKPKTQELA
jgi:hypothetical protein